MRILSFFAALAVASAFSPVSTRLQMGGYYSEPDVQSDKSKTHMIFGLRCAETQTLVNGKTIVGLRVEEEDDLGRGIVNYILQNNIDLSGKTIVEIGASSASVVACLALGASSVVACHPEEQRLRVLEHTQQFMNLGLQTACKFRTDTLEDEVALPRADFVFVTLRDDSTVNRVAEAFHQGSRLIMPASATPMDGLSNYDLTEYNGMLDSYVKV